MYTIRFKGGRTVNVGSKTARAMRSMHMPHTGVKQQRKDRERVRLCPVGTGVLVTLPTWLRS